MWALVDEISQRTVRKFDRQRRNSGNTYVGSPEPMTINTPDRPVLLWRAQVLKCVPLARFVLILGA